MASVRWYDNSDAIATSDGNWLRFYNRSSETIELIQPIDHRFYSENLLIKKHGCFTCVQVAVVLLLLLLLLLFTLTLVDFLLTVLTVSRNCIPQAW